MNRRKILGLLQKDIAPMLGVGEACISIWECRGGTIRTVYFPRIAQFLGYEWWQFDTSTLGGRIQDYRYRNGLRAEDFAKLVGIENSGVRRWERGMSKPPKEMVRKIDAVLEHAKPLE